VRIVRLANFVAPRSGGLRTALRELGAGYLAAGHEPVLIVPGDCDHDAQTPQGRVITLRGPLVPLSGGYRLLLSRRRVTAMLNALRPDRLEVSDRVTLRWTGPWARRHRVPAVVVSHESLAGLLGLPGRWLAGPAEAIADALNTRTARHYRQVICTTNWAASEFERLGVPNIRRIPLGVDLSLFTPRLRSQALRMRYAAPDQVLIVHCGRLLATADVVLAPGPVETFGLAALEALACGTPVVVSADSALPEVIGSAGVSATGEDFAAGVCTVLSWPSEKRRAAARARAEEFGWEASVGGFLAAHGVSEAVPA
jgi:alpha-1,6-mannosyltransferase